MLVRRIKVRVGCDGKVKLRYVCLMIYPTIDTSV